MKLSLKLAGTVAGVALVIGSGGFASAASAASATCSNAPSGTCGSEVNVSGNAFNAKGQSTKTGTKVIAYPNSTGSGGDFNAVQSGGANTRQFEFAPKNKLSGECLSEPSVTAKSGISLRPCRAASSSLVKYQQFTGVNVNDTSGTQWTNVESGLKIQANGTDAQLIAVKTVTNLGGSYWGWDQAAVIPGTTYVKNGTYKFASNSGGVWQIGAAPVVAADATQTLGASGVTVSTQASSYADSGVIVDLGKLDTLFNSGGAYVAPAIVGSATLSYNLYFDTDSNGGFLSFSSNGVYEGPGGDNIADMGLINNTADSAVFQSGQQGSTLLSGTMNMEAVEAAYAARTSGTKDPEVWAWIGIDGSTAQSATVTSVDGTALVNAGG